MAYFDVIDVAWLDVVTGMSVNYTMFQWFTTGLFNKYTQNENIAKQHVSWLSQVSDEFEVPARNVIRRAKSQHGIFC